MERHGHEQRMDPRSWEEQGRGDLASLREEKTLRGYGQEARERNEQIDDLRRQRAELPAPHLDQARAIESMEQKAEQQIARVQEREAQEISRLDKLIAAARELATQVATEVKERTVAVAHNVAERMEQLRGRYERWREERAGPKAEQNLDTQPGSRSQEKQEQQRAGPELTLEQQIEQRRQAFEARYEAYQQAREPAPELAPAQEPAVVLEPQAREVAVEKEPDQEQKIERGPDFGIGM